MTAGVMLPLVQALPASLGEGLHEDSWETLRMLANSATLRWASLLFIATMAVYNLTGGWRWGGGGVGGVGAAREAGRLANAFARGAHAALAR